MPTTDQLQFEMQRRVILFNSGTAMPDNSLLGYEGNPNLAGTSTPGRTLLNDSPQGTYYIQLANGNLWYKKQKTPSNLWINLSEISGNASGDFANYSNANFGSVTFSSISGISGSGIVYGSTGIFKEVYADNIVYDTGNQTIDGIKTFTTRPKVNTFNVLIEGDSIGEGTLPQSILYTTGNQQIISSKTFSGNNIVLDFVNGATILISGQPVLTGIPDNAWATQNELDTTGIALVNRINSLSGSLDSSGISLTNTINSLSGTLTNNYATITNVGLTGIALTNTINSLSGSLNSSGIALTNTINSLSGLSVLLTGNQNISGVKNFSSRPTVNGTGILLEGEAAQLPNTIVYTTGDQIIDGIKTFNSGIIIHDSINGLPVDLKTFNITTPNSAWPLIISGGSNTMGAFDTVLAAGSAGEFGSHGNLQLNAGGERNQAFVKIKGNVDINNYGGEGILSSFSPGIGHPTGTEFSFRVYKSGSNNGYGQYPAVRAFEINQTGIYTRNITPIFADAQIYISGNPVLTGIPDDSWATQNELDSTGLALINRISSLSGSLNTSGISISATIASLSGNLTSNYATITNVELTGIALTNTINLLSGSLDSSGISLTNTINSLSGTLNSSGIALVNVINLLSGAAVLLTGNQTVSGVKNFISRPTVNGTGVLLSGEAASLPNTIVYTTGNQIISGNKTFANNLEIQGTGIFSNIDLSNISSFSFSGVTIDLINSIINSSGQILISGNPVLTGIPDSAWATQNELDSTGLALINRISSLSGSLNSSGINLTNTINSLSGSLNSTGINLINWINSLTGSLNSSGIVLTNTINSLSGLAVLTTGNQIISGNKTFRNNVEIISPVSGMYGTGDLLNALNVRGFASVGADLSSLTGIFNTGAVSLSGVSPGQFSAGNMLIGQNEGGAYLGRVGIRENSWQVLSGTEGVNWTARQSSRDWCRVAISCDGRIQTAVASNDGIYTSYDYGVTWTARESNRNWNCNAMSSDGKIQTAAVVADYIYTSYDYGVNWTPRKFIPGLGGIIGSIAMSSDGKIQVAAGFNGGRINISYDYGVTWIEKESNIINYTGIAISSDGRIQTVTTIGDYIYTSYDYGLTWIARNSIQNYRQVAMSSDGRIQTAVVYSGLIYTSYDYGVTWTARGSNNNWYSIAMSSDGRIQIAGNYSGQIYVSYDYGVTWIARQSNRSWLGVAMSSDGRIIAAVANLNRIYISSATTITPNSINVLGSINAYNESEPQSLRIFNATGVNSGEFGTFSWTGNNLIIGAQQSQSGILRDVIITGRNININASDALNIFDPVNITGNVNVAGNIFISGNPVLTGIPDGSWASQNELDSTGLALVNRIDSLSGSLNSSGISISNTIASLSGTLNSSGVSISNTIASLSGNVVFLTGNQNISGNKNFLNNISVSGTGIFNALDLGNIDSLSLSGIDISITGSTVNVFGNILISGNPVLTGIPDSAWATQSELDSTGIALVNRIASLSGSLNNSGINLINWTNSLSGSLNSSGIALVNRIDSLSGSLNSSGINLINTINSLSGSLNNTGINLLNRINSLSGYINSTSSNIVFTTGNQNIGGNKTFTGVTTFSGQEVNLVDTALNLSGVGDMTFSGTNINFINSPVYISGTNLRVDGNILLSGNPVLTGIPDGSWATQNELDATGIALVNRISSLSGSLNSSGIALTNTINSLSGSLNSTGINLISTINLLSGYINSSSSNIVFTTGNQTINGLKTFTSGIDIYSGAIPQVLRIFDSTGINSGEFAIFGWRNDNLIIGTQQTQSGLLRDVVITGRNININASGVLNIIDPVNISGNTVITGHLSATSKSFLIDHPTQAGKKLQYGSLESPYHGIRLTDKNKLITDSVKVNLPDYISSLVDNEKVNIQLTNINHDKVLFVKDININENNFIVGMNRSWFDKNEYEFYWSFTAERKDIPKLTVEF